MKRFTETAKWSDPWFRKLPHTLKIGYLYLLDNVDNAGVIDLDRDLADFQIGVSVDWPALEAALGERLQMLPCGKWHLTRFVRFQCGELSSASKPHQQVRRLMDLHGIENNDQNQSQTDTLPKGYPKGIHTHKEKEKEKETDKDTEKETGRRSASLFHDDTPPPPKTRERNPLFDALAAATDGDADKLTTPTARAVGVALAQIRKASPDVTPEEIARRARNYRVHFRDATLTASALAKHWARCESATIASSSPIRVAV